MENNIIKTKDGRNVVSIGNPLLPDTSFWIAYYDQKLPEEYANILKCITGELTENTRNYTVYIPEIVFLEFIYIVMREKQHDVKQKRLNQLNKFYKEFPEVNCNITRNILPELLKSSKNFFDAYKIIIDFIGEKTSEVKNFNDYFLVFIAQILNLQLITCDKGIYDFASKIKNMHKPVYVNINDRFQ